MRVLVLATTFPARPGDGTPEFVLSLSRALVERGVEIHVVVPRVAGAASTEVIDGVRVHRFAYFPQRWEGLADGAIMANLRSKRRRWLEVPPLVAAFAKAARAAAKRFGPDVVHAHWIVPAGMVAAAVRGSNGLPYVVTAHGADAYTLRSSVAAKAKAWVLRGAAATVPVSEAIGAELAALGAVGSIHSPVPMGVDVEEIRRAVGPRQVEPGRVLFLGRLVEKKGVVVLLHAAAQVPEARLVIVGDGPQRPELEALAGRLGLTARTCFLGRSPTPAVMEELARAAVMAIPSQVGAGGDQDGTPVVLGEAMAAGVPVVASDLGGLAEHLTDGKTARLVRPGSVDDLAGALREVLADPDGAEAMAREASQRLLGRLDVGSVADRYLTVLRAAAGS